MIDKKAIIKKYQSHSKDNGSPQVQIAMLTHRILDLTEHLKKNPNDKHSRRGLIGLVGDRRRHMRYLELQDNASYKTLVADLGLRA